ncbi:MAG TPA: ribonuclease HII [Steroidobacteraceae bacterium]|nr:ribonuclease HII [Steroidobacteraceae bacterium]
MRTRFVAGVDEAGRGPLAGPVMAAAVILRRGAKLDGVRDSKLLTAAERERLEPEIRAQALASAVGWADVEEIEALNILGATLLAMRRALLGLAVRPTHVQVDGNRCPSLDSLGCAMRGQAIVRGDASVLAISAASILAKTFRDRMMRRFDEIYPHYGFGAHAGYGTPQHLRALAAVGPCPLHRRSFAPVESAAEALRAGETLAVVNRRLTRVAIPVGN